MGYQTIPKLDRTIVIAKDASESSFVDLASLMCVGFITPAAIEATTAQISFKSCATVDGTYLPVYKGGTKLVLPIAVNEWAFLTGMNDLYGIRFLKIVAETSGGAAVAQATAARTFGLICLENL